MLPFILPALAGIGARLGIGSLIRYGGAAAIGASASGFFGGGGAGKKKKRRKRKRLTHGEMLEIIQIKETLGKTAAATILPFYLGRG